jgi:lipid II:glycine glycyltransferase (peptidoglycan interpeptide bridge formation enzyme)
LFGATVQKLEFSPSGNDGSFLQTPFWGLFKSRHGWNLIRARASFSEENLSQKQFDFSILVRSFAKGFFSLAYVPLFPNAELLKAVGANDSAGSKEGGRKFLLLLEEIAQAAKALLPKNTICVRFDPALEFATPQERDAFVKEASRVNKAAAKKNAVDIQPPDTTQVDLTRTEDEILAAMKNKWRYNIKLAQKKGVVVEKTSGNALNLSDFVDIFYDLYKVTSARDGIAMHAKAYYKDLLELSAQEAKKNCDVPQVNLYVAKHEDDYLGAIMTLFSKTEAVYLYGCSSNEKRNLMPNFLLQWTAMQDAKAYGSKYYDMYGMPPTDDPSHPMHGLYLFKTGFGGRNVHRAGTWDVPLKGIYKLCVLAEGARAFWHKKVLKKIRGR